VPSNARTLILFASVGAFGWWWWEAVISASGAELLLLAPLAVALAVAALRARLGRTPLPVLEAVGGVWIGSLVGVAVWAVRLGGSDFVQQTWEKALILAACAAVLGTFGTWAGAVLGRWSGKPQ
jgi:predicted membrane protein